MSVNIKMQLCSQKWEQNRTEQKENVSLCVDELPNIENTPFGKIRIKGFFFNFM
jgi:hypothetical protein